MRCPFSSSRAGHLPTRIRFVRVFVYAAHKAKLVFIYSKARVHAHNAEKSARARAFRASVPISASPRPHVRTKVNTNCFPQNTRLLGQTFKQSRLPSGDTTVREVVFWMRRPFTIHLISAGGLDGAVLHCSGISSFSRASDGPLMDTCDGATVGWGMGVHDQKCMLSICAQR